MKPGFVIAVRNRFIKEALDAPCPSDIDQCNILIIKETFLFQVFLQRIIIRYGLSFHFDLKVRIFNQIHKFLSKLSSPRIYRTQRIVRLQSVSFQKRLKIADVEVEHTT